MSASVLVSPDGAGTSTEATPAVVDGNTLTPPTVKTILMGGTPRAVEGDTAVLLPGVAEGETV